MKHLFGKFCNLLAEHSDECMYVSVGFLIRVLSLPRRHVFIVTFPYNYPLGAVPASGSTDHVDMLPSQKKPWGKGRRFEVFWSLSRKSDEQSWMVVEVTPCLSGKVRCVAYRSVPSWALATPCTVTGQEQWAVSRSVPPRSWQWHSTFQALLIHPVLERAVSGDWTEIRLPRSSVEE